jgi:hypothetical protein
MFYAKGFSQFVASPTALVASGWSESCRVGLATHWMTVPFHGAQIR